MAAMGKKGSFGAEDSIAAALSAILEVDFLLERILKLVVLFVLGCGGVDIIIVVVVVAEVDVRVDDAGSRCLAMRFCCQSLVGDFPPAMFLLQMPNQFFLLGEKLGAQSAANFLLLLRRRQITHPPLLLLLLLLPLLLLLLPPLLPPRGKALALDHVTGKNVFGQEASVAEKAVEGGFASAFVSLEFAPTFEGIFAFRTVGKCVGGGTDVGAPFRCRFSVVIFVVNVVVVVSVLLAAERLRQDVGVEFRLVRAINVLFQVSFQRKSYAARSAADARPSGGGGIAGGVSTVNALIVAAAVSLYRRCN